MRSVITAIGALATMLALALPAAASASTSSAPGPAARCAHGATATRQHRSCPARRAHRAGCARRSRAQGPARQRPGCRREDRAAFADGKHPPTTSLTSDTTSGSTTISTGASFAFASNRATARFACSLDDSAFAGCTSPASYAALAAGSHSFQVHAIDHGLVGSPAVVRWTVGAAAQAPATGQTWTCGLASFSDGDAFSIPPSCWRPFSDSSWLNTPLPANPKLTVNGVDGENGDSAQLVASLMSHRSGDVQDVVPISGTDYQHALYVGRPSDPVYTISCQPTGRNCDQANSAIGQQVHIPCGATVPNGTDMQLFVIDQAGGYEWDLSGITPGEVLCGGGTFNVGLATRIRLSGDGRNSCASDAACVGESAGQVREPELEAGSINHAIFIVNGDCDNTGTPTSVYPAVPYNSCAGNHPGSPKVGQWYYLALSDAQIAATGFPSWQQTILLALAHYGMFVGDQGSNGAFDIFTESQYTYSSFKQRNPWVAYAQRLAQDPANNVKSATSSSVSLGMDNIPHTFWTANLRAVSPCTIQRAC